MVIPSETDTTSYPEEETSIDLRQYLALFRQWWWLILLATVVAGGAAYGISLQMTPIYKASTTLLINQAPANKAVDYNSMMASELLARTYSEMMTKRPVLEQAIKRLGLNLSPEAMAEMITVSPVRDTQLVVVDVQGPDPGLNAAVANALVLVFSDQVTESQNMRFASSKESLKTQLTDAENQILATRQAIQVSQDPAETARLETRLNQYEQTYSNLMLSYENIRLTETQTSASVVQVEQAIVPRAPISPNPIRNAMLAAAVGMMLSVGGVFAYDALDDTLKNPEEVNRHLKLPVMGVIGRYDEPDDGELVTKAQPRSPVAEAFRALRTNVQYASVNTPMRTLIVTSPAPGDGKTTVAANLAMVTAQGGKRVTIMDADLHRPRVHRMFGTEQRPGLSALFIKPTVRLNGSAQPTSLDRLRVVGAGDLPPNPSELLGSRKMRDIISTVLSESDTLILDTPPVLSVTDAMVLAPIVDGVLLVVRPGVTKMAAIRATVEQLRNVGANIIGVVLNGVDNKSSRYGYYYKSYYYTQYKYYRTNGKAPASALTLRRVSRQEPESAPMRELVRDVRNTEYDYEDGEEN